MDLNTGNAAVLFILRESLPKLLKFSLFIASLIKKNTVELYRVYSLAYYTTIIPRNWRSIHNIRYFINHLQFSNVIKYDVYTYSYKYTSTYTRAQYLTYFNWNIFRALWLTLLTRNVCRMEFRLFLDIVQLIFNNAPVVTTAVYHPSIYNLFLMS